ncbi:hypothetical protein MTR_0273s0030 [Medicago truncatula]|uniref:Uncharacterized protein n=1 Tax=Medicago truncatula TaxID=3880 RepID=A0A072TGW0_MEDTR|nr:hypothetical protein MTR_0273s0030 [Medicago truncatula]
MDAYGIITSGVHSEDLDLRWLTKLKIQADALILEKLKGDSGRSKGQRSIAYQELQ